MRDSCFFAAHVLHVIGGSLHLGSFRPEHARENTNVKTVYRTTCTTLPKSTQWQVKKKGRGGGFRKVCISCECTRTLSQLSHAFLPCASISHSLPRSLSLPPLWPWLAIYSSTLKTYHTRPQFHVRDNGTYSFADVYHDHKQDRGNE